MSNKYGYIILDRDTGLMDWDDRIHPTVEDAIASLTGQFQATAEPWQKKQRTASSGGRTTASTQ